jgi:hypothetical protein
MLIQLLELEAAVVTAISRIALCKMHLTTSPPRAGKSPRGARLAAPNSGRSVGPAATRADRILFPQHLPGACRRVALAWPRRGCSG